MKTIKLYRRVKWRTIKAVRWVPGIHDSRILEDVVYVRRAGSWGLLLNPNAWWLGVHYSPRDGRHCINLIPCLTLWITKQGGREP